MPQRAPVPPITIVEPGSPLTVEPGPAPAGGRAHAGRDAPGPVPDAARAAARRVLDRDGVDLVLRPWQAAWLHATAAGHRGSVPAGCGVGGAWLQARLDEETGTGGVASD